MSIGPAAMGLMKSHIADWTDAHGAGSWKRDPTGDFVAKNDVFYNNFEVHLGLKLIPKLLSIFFYR